MLIHSLADRLRGSKAVDALFARLDCGESPTIAAPPAVRSLLVAATFARNPRPTLVVMPGDDAARRFALGLRLYLGREKAMHFPVSRHEPWSDKDDDPETAGRPPRPPTAFVSVGSAVSGRSRRPAVSGSSSLSDHGSWRETGKCMAFSRPR